MENKSETERIRRRILERMIEMYKYAGKKIDDETMKNLKKTVDIYLGKEK